MKTLKAHVKGGRLRVDEPTTFPEGTEFDLTVADLGDDLDEQERVALHNALNEAWKAARGGEVRSAEELLRKLKSSE